jgi:hypothetical protein
MNWISVKEKLPEEVLWHTHLILADSGRVFSYQGYYDGNRFYCYSGWDERKTFVDDVTHWMMYPECPKDDTPQV